MKQRNYIGTRAGSWVLLLCFLSALFLSGCGSVTRAAADTQGTATITEYYTYGTFLQLKGKVVVSSEESVKKVSLVLRSGSSPEDEVYRAELPFQTVSKGKALTFRTSDKLDEGLCLETLPKGNFAALLELTDSSGDVQLLSLRDGSAAKRGEASSGINYYTLPYRHGRRRVTASFETVGGTENLIFHIKRSRLPSDVYDIVVDPGHGGKDPGAQAAGYDEKDIVLDIGKRLASDLERAGYKVLLTRDGTEDPNVNMAYTEYDEDGRVNRTCGSRAKLCLSLHLNYNSHENQSGVQIYKARKAGNGFASFLADGLVASTDLSYSTMGGRTADGVYVRTFTNADIREAQAKAKKKGYTFYNVSTSTDYFFMIREYGCIATGAYVDGRNPEYGTNEYRTFPQGVESCLCELGFLSNEQDRQILLNHQRGISRALTDAVDAYIASLYTTKETGTPSADLLAKETV